MMFRIVGEMDREAKKKPRERGIKMNEETEMGFKREKIRASECPSNPFSL